MKPNNITGQIAGADAAAFALRWQIKAICALTAPRERPLRDAAINAVVNEVETLRAALEKSETSRTELAVALTQCFETGTLTPLTPNTMRDVRAALIKNLDQNAGGAK